MSDEWCGEPCEAFRSIHGPVRCSLKKHDGSHHFVFSGVNTWPEGVPMPDQRDSAEIERLKDAVVAASERMTDNWPPRGFIAADVNAVHSCVDALRAARRPKLIVECMAGGWQVCTNLCIRAAFYGPTAEADARAYAKTKESQG